MAGWHWIKLPLSQSCCTDVHLARSITSSFQGFGDDIPITDFGRHLRLFEQCDNHRQPMHLVVTVKSAMEPNTRKELALDKQGLAFSGQSSHLAACSAVISCHRENTSSSTGVRCPLWKPEAKWLYERLTVTAAAVLFAGPLAASSDPMKTQSNSGNGFPEWDELTGRK